MKVRTATILFLGGVLALTAACGGGDDDDDDDDDDNGGDSADNDANQAKFGDGGGGTLKIDGKSYKVELASCLIKHEASGNLTGWDGTLKGESGSTFAGTGVDNAVTVAISLDEDSGYLAQAEVDIDGRNISWKGDGFTLPDSKSVKVEFDLECDN